MTDIVEEMRDIASELRLHKDSVRWNTPKGKRLYEVLEKAASEVVALRDKLRVLQSVSGFVELTPPFVDIKNTIRGFATKQS